MSARSGLVALAMVSIACSGVRPAQAASIDETIVYIECTSPGKPPRKGSGVVVSADGVVLTAKHVVFGAEPQMPSGTTCSGAIGNANRAKSGLFLQATSAQYDAVLLKLPVNGVPFQRFCRLEPRLQRSQIIATGFPLLTGTGVPSSRVGVLSTVQPDGAGYIETDSTTTSGMSGGMVTLAANGHLIGIVSGAKTDPGNGLLNYSAVLAVQVLANEFVSWGLSEDPEGCADKARTSGPQGTVHGRPWEATDPPLHLGMKVSEGVCFLVRVWGYFDDPDDLVAVTETDGEYVLMGVNDGSGPHGAYADCLRF
ncbi:serine protease [Rhodobacteraceae bacterium DSL-40]|uniref:S1 family peptidase n=1 Tax=Amaricoccus sp. B4 TaxID=3368557 RepID=UPI000DAE1501